MAPPKNPKRQSAISLSPSSNLTVIPRDRLADDLPLRDVADGGDVCKLANRVGRYPDSELRVLRGQLAVDARRRPAGSSERGRLHAGSLARCENGHICC